MHQHLTRYAKQGQIFLQRQDGVLWGLLPFVLLVCLWPMIRLLLEGLQGSGEGYFSHFENVLSQARSWNALWQSLWVSFAATLMSLFLGGGFAFLVALTNIRAKEILIFSFMIPMMIPPQITALAWLQLMGPNSVLLGMLGMAPEMGSDQPLYSAGGIILLLGVQHSAIIFLVLRAHLRLIPREHVEAARLAGGSGVRLWWQIVVPVTSPGLIAATSMTFVTALGNFGIPAMLGIPANFEMLPTLIYARLSGYGPAVLSEVAVLALLVSLVAICGVSLHHYMVRHRQYHLHGIVGHSLLLDLGRWRSSVEYLLWGLIILILGIPLIALMAASFVPAFGVSLSWETLTLAAYHEIIFQQSVTFRAFLNSLGLSISAAVTLMCLSILLAYAMHKEGGFMSRLINISIELPYALPGVVLAIACILTFQRLPLVDISLYGTLALIFIAYLARFFVIALRPVLSSFSQMDPNLEQAAQACGASKGMRLRTVLCPMVAPAAAAGGIFVFLTAFNELTVSALLWASGNETIGVLIFNLDDSGDSVLASAVAVLVVLLVFALMLFLERIAHHLPKGVVPWHV